MKKSSLYFSTLFMFMSCFVFGQTPQFFENTNSPGIERIDPPNWFSGMNNSEVELLFYSNGREELTISLHPESEKYVSLLSVEKSKINNYYYVDLSVKSQPKDNHIFFIVNSAGSSASLMLSYSITPKTGNPQGLSQADAMYMVFPDRFANGDSKNDSLPNYFQGAHRDELKGRRGGDIQGICDHLDYISELGFTALWIKILWWKTMKKETLITDMQPLTPT
ncbi:MAG: hypothetical protein RI989_1586 [Bacteroidota bacterium]